MFDKNFILKESSSGMLQAADAEVLGNLEVNNLQCTKDGFLYIYTNNESYYDVDFDNSSRILTASLRIAHKRNIVLEVNTYYPYGMLNTSLSWHLTNNQYKYQGKEYLNTLNYNVLDFGARMYDPAIARFTTPDPIMQFNNGYFAMGGNPVNMIDPTGMKSTTGHYDDVQEHGLSETPERGGGGSPVTIDGMPVYGSTPMLEHIMGELMAKGPDGEDNILGYSSSTLSVNIIQKDDKIFTSFNPVYQMVNTINNNYKSKYAHYNINGKDDRESGETDDYFTGYSYGLAIPKNAITSWDLDHDGKFQLIEAAFHYRNGNGVPIQIEGSQVNLSGLDPNLFSGKSKNEVVAVNLYFTDFFGEGVIYGSLDFKYLGGNQVQILPNRYDFETGAEYKYPWFGTNSQFWRNVGTKLGNAVNGPGIPYWIYFHGSSTLTSFPK